MGIRDGGFDIGSPWTEGDFLPDDLELIEWGKMNVLVDSYLQGDKESFERSKYLNSKLNQSDWKVQFDITKLRSKLISSEEQLIDYLTNFEFPIVLKAEFGLAGRNHIIIENPGQGWKLQQVNKKLFRYPILAEEWVGKSRSMDFSTLWDFHPHGPIYLGSTEMIIDVDGSFRGISMSASKEKQLTQILPLCLDTMKDIYAKAEYKPVGPAAMDGFFFLRNSQTQIQLLSEINFRYSMGRILYEIRKRRNIRIEESGILFLPLNKMKLFNEETCLTMLKEESKAEFFFVTPLRDWKGKHFQNVGLYYETNGSSLPAHSIIGWIFEQWKNKIED
jgi:hypothetical protein